MLSFFQWRVAWKVKHISTGRVLRFHGVNDISGELWLASIGIDVGFFPEGSFVLEV